MDVITLHTEHLPLLLDTWLAHRSRTPQVAPADRLPWSQPLAARQAFVAKALQRALQRDPERHFARAIMRENRVAAFLLGREVRLPRTTSYRAYMPDHFSSTGADEWAVAEPRDARLLAALYADLTAWGLGRGIAAHQVGLSAGDDATELWSDFGFARHDCYAFLPLAATHHAAEGVTIRRAGPADLAIAAEFSLAEAEHHQLPPICAFAPPRLSATKLRDMTENLADPDALVFLAELDGQPVGGLTASFLPERPFWGPAALPTPCAFIESAYVRPAARGRRVLRSLVAALATTLAERAAQGLFVTYLPVNTSAALAWRGLGFAPLLTIHLRRLDPRAVRQQAGTARHGE